LRSAALRPTAFLTCTLSTPCVASRAVVRFCRTRSFAPKVTASVDPLTDATNASMAALSAEMEVRRWRVFSLRSEIFFAASATRFAYASARALFCALAAGAATGRPSSMSTCRWYRRALEPPWAQRRR
jgi:hypothetical protein